MTKSGVKSVYYQCTDNICCTFIYCTFSDKINKSETDISSTLASIFNISDGHYVLFIVANAFGYQAN